MSDITRLGITTAFCCVIFIVEGLTESGILLLVPAGGRYDPEALWDTDIADLVGVNDCQDDETLDVVHLAMKGTFRNSRMFNLSYYENVQLDFLVYSEHGEELLNVTSCQKTDTVSCTFGSQTLTKGNVTWKDGFKLFVNNTQETLVSVFNPRHFLSDAPDGVSIVISSNSQVATFPDPGHKGCYATPSTGTVLSPLTLETCFNQCTPDTYFLLSNTECFCESSLTTAKEEESMCMELCPDDNKQLCGSATTAIAYTSSSFEAFRDFYNALNQTEELQNGTVDETTSTGQVTFTTPTYINAAEVIVEEECQLTNLYFDQPPTSFNVLIDSDCSNTDPNYHTTLDGSGDYESFSAVQAKCVYLHAETNNYTYPRARIIIYGPTGNIKNVGGMFVIKGTWTIPEESSSLSTMVEETSSVDISSTDIQMTATDQTIMPSTSMGIASPTVGISATYSTDGGTMEATPTIDAGAASTPEATLGATAAHSDATISATGPFSGATIAATAASSASSPASSAAAATTTRGTGVATTTSKPKIYTKDGRLIYEACTCLCKQPPLKENQTPLEQAQVKAQELSEELQVNTKNLSATIRKKESASDERPSASAGGYVACAIMGVMGVMFIAADVVSISAHIQMLKSNVGSMFGKN